MPPCPWRMRGGNAHGDDEWADPKTFDLFGEWLSRFLANPEKYAR